METNDNINEKIMETMINLYAKIDLKCNDINYNIIKNFISIRQHYNINNNYTIQYCQNMYNSYEYIYDNIKNANDTFLKIYLEPIINEGAVVMWHYSCQYNGDLNYYDNYIRHIIVTIMVLIYNIDRSFNLNIIKGYFNKPDGKFILFTLAKKTMLRELFIKCLNDLNDINKNKNIDEINNIILNLFININSSFNTYLNEKLT